MDVSLFPAPVGGTVAAPPSKSDAHRRLICAALSGRDAVVAIPTLSKDIEATAACISALGMKTQFMEQGICIEPGSPKATPHLDCGESGSTLRFMLPVAAALSDRAEFAGHGRLPQRPIGELRQAMEEHNVRFSAQSLPFTIEGKMNSGLFRLPGNVSSQYISGLLLALPKLSGDSEILLSSPLQSRGYVDITLKCLRDFGIEVKATPEGWLIPGGQSFVSKDALTVEGDWSNAAFFLCAGALSKPVTVTGLDPASPQGDKAVVDLLSEMGSSVEISGNRVSVSPAPLHGCEIDMGDIPDLLPVLAVTAACAQGETLFYNAGRLREKESDRISTTAAMLSALGARCKELPEGLIVYGGALRGGTVDGCNDHRIVMAAAVASVMCSEKVHILGAEAVEKSFPDFFSRFESLGGKILTD